jgi:hypothetical protein
MPQNRSAGTPSGSLAKAKSRAPKRKSSGCKNSSLGFCSSKLRHLTERSAPAARCSGTRAAGAMGDDYQRQVYQLNQLPENQVRARLIRRRASPRRVARARRPAASLVVPTGFSERASCGANGTPPRAACVARERLSRGETTRRRRASRNERLTRDSILPLAEFSSPVRCLVRRPATETRST